jgi:hypothetical protein
LEENLVGIGVADAAEEPGIGESALQGVIGRGENRGEVRQIGFENLQAARIELAQPSFSGDHVERSALLGASLGPEQTSAGKVEGRETSGRRDFGSAFFSVKPAGDHQMQHQPKVLFEADANALPHPA